MKPIMLNLDIYIQRNFQKKNEYEISYKKFKTY